jgi:very-short-patch-repair endonuclease
MRNNPTEPEKRLWRALSDRQLGFKFRRQAVIPPYIADFLCPSAKLIIEVDGDTHDDFSDQRRNAVLAARGYRVVRVSNGDVMGNIEGVAEFILEALRGTSCPHPNPSPEGEGLSAVEAQKLLGISLEGSVG